MGFSGRRISVSCKSGGWNSHQERDTGRKEDIKVLWDALKWSIEVEEPGDDLESRSEVLHKYDDDAGWARLSNIMDLSLEEWLAQVDVAEDDQEVG